MSTNRNDVYLELNAENIRLHIAEANLANDYHLKAAAIAAKKAQNYARMLEINTEVLNQKPVQPYMHGREKKEKP